MAVVTAAATMVTTAAMAVIAAAVVVVHIALDLDLGCSEGAVGLPTALDLNPHALAPVAVLPVRDVISATHIIADDLTLGLGKVVYDYLKD